MNTNIKEKRGKIVQKVTNIINNFDYKNLEYLDNYFDSIFHSNIQKFINKCEEKKRNHVECNSLSDEYVNEYCSMTSFNPTSGIYFKQDGPYFTYSNEDKITYDILVNLHRIYPNMSTSNKVIIKRNIIKKIKSNSYEDIIPNSNTIQLVINFLTPFIFETKEQSKFFLTFIGDLILRKKKEQNQKCFIVNCNDNFKAFLCQLSKYINLFIYNMNIFNHIKLKFYHHDTSRAEILYLNHNIDYTYFHKDISFYITFIFICIYHSNKYESSSNFLQRYEDNDNIQYIQTLKQINKETLIKQFWDESIIIKNDTLMKENTILFIWKKYLKSKKLPIYLFYHQDAINIFKEYYSKHFNKGPDNTTYHGITSFEIPEIDMFLNFWDNTIIHDSNERFLEIEEIQYFLKQYLKDNNLSLCNKYYSNPQNIYDIINHYYPDLKCEQNKYYHGIKIKKWDKKGDVIKFKLTFGETTHKTEKLYNFYCKFKKDIQEKDTIVSKIYFLNIYDLC